MSSTRLTDSVPIYLSRQQQVLPQNRWPSTDPYHKHQETEELSVPLISKVFAKYYIPETASENCGILITPLGDSL